MKNGTASLNGHKITSEPGTIDQALKQAEKLLKSIQNPQSKTNEKELNPIKTAAKPRTMKLEIESQGENEIHMKMDRCVFYSLMEMISDVGGYAKFLGHDKQRDMNNAFKKAISQDPHNT